MGILVQWIQIPVNADPSFYVFDVIDAVKAVEQAEKAEKDGKALVEQMKKDDDFDGDGYYEKQEW